MLDEVLEEVEQREIRPVQVLDDEYRRIPLGDRLEERAPRGERLGALDARSSLEPDERQQALLEPCTLVTFGKHGPELVRVTSGVSLSKMPACAFTISPSAQKAMPSP